MSTLTAEIEAFLLRYPDLEFGELLKPDMNGILRGKRISKDEFVSVFRAGINQCAADFMLDCKGQTFDDIPHGGRDGDPDIICWPVPGSLSPVPWASRPTAQALTTSETQGQGGHFAEPRAILGRLVDRFHRQGLRPVTAVELEFFLVEEVDGALRPRLSNLPGTTIRQTGSQYSSLQELQAIDPFLLELAETCGAQGIPAGTALSEFAEGQFEVNLHHIDDPVKACDQAVLLKRAVKAVAARHELSACFMAKPFADLAGSGLHVHVSLLDDEGLNVFSGGDPGSRFSETLRYAAGGLLATMAEGMAIFAPNANSYRRLRPKLYVPLAPSWGFNHRNTAVRVPMSNDENRRLEHRVAGADSNPYLVMTAILAGIHHGLDQRLDPGPMVMPGEQLEEQITLPIRWETALEQFEQGTVIQEYLGAEYSKLFKTCRREESDRIHREIPPQDYQWYLRSV